MLDSLWNLANITQFSCLDLAAETSIVLFWEMRQDGLHVRIVFHTRLNNGEDPALPPCHLQMGYLHVRFSYFAPLAMFLICFLHHEHLADRCMSGEFIFTIIFSGRIGLTCKVTSHLSTEFEQ